MGGWSLWSLESLAGISGVVVSGLLLLTLRRPKEIWDLHEGEGLLSRLKKRRERLLRALKDLENEREAGVLSDEEFVSLRRKYKRRAIIASRELDRVRRSRLRMLSSGDGSLSPSRRRRVESLVKQRKESS